MRSIKVGKPAWQKSYDFAWQKSYDFAEWIVTPKILGKKGIRY